MHFDLKDRRITASLSPLLLVTPTNDDLHWNRRSLPSKVIEGKDRDQRTDREEHHVSTQKNNGHLSLLSDKEDLVHPTEFLRRQFLRLDQRPRLSNENIDFESDQRKGDERTCRVSFFLAVPPVMHTSPPRARFRLLCFCRLVHASLLRLDIRLP